jgi:hypothetical protein
MRLASPPQSYVLLSRCGTSSNNVQRQAYRYRSDPALLETGTVDMETDVVDWRRRSDNAIHVSIIETVAGRWMSSSDSTIRHTGRGLTR